MFLGKVTISEKVMKEVPLKTIYKELEQYKEDGIYFIDQVFSGSEPNDTIPEPNLLFKKQVYIDDKLILYIETYKGNGGTKVLEGMEYLEREIKNFAYTFNFRENNFLKVILERYKEDGTPYEQKTAYRILRKLSTLEMQKSNYRERLIDE